MNKLRHTVSILLATCLMSGSATAQSMVDLAKRERARQKSAESKSVLDRDSLQGATSAATVAPATPTTTPAATAAPVTPAAPVAATSKAQRPTGPTDIKGRDEKFWREAFAKARQEVKRAQDKLTVLQLKANDLNTRILNDSIYTRAMAEQQELDKTNQDLAVAQHELNVAQQKVADLEEELRRSGGLPGWAR